MTPSLIRKPGTLQRDAKPLPLPSDGSGAETISWIAANEQAQEVIRLLADIQQAEQRFVDAVITGRPVAGRAAVQASEPHFLHPVQAFALDLAVPISGSSALSVATAARAEEEYRILQLPDTTQSGSIEDADKEGHAEALLATFDSLSQRTARIPSPNAHVLRDAQEMPEIPSLKQLSGDREIVALPEKSFCLVPQERSAAAALQDSLSVGLPRYADVRKALLDIASLLSKRRNLPAPLSSPQPSSELAVASHFSASSSLPNLQTPVERDVLAIEEVRRQMYLRSRIPPEPYVGLEFPWKALLSFNRFRRYAFGRPLPADRRREFLSRVDAIRRGAERGGAVASRPPLHVTVVPEEMEVPSTAGTQVETPMPVQRDWIPDAAHLSVDPSLLLQSLASPSDLQTLRSDFARFPLRSLFWWKSWLFQQQQQQQKQEAEGKEESHWLRDKFSSLTPAARRALLLILLQDRFGGLEYLANIVADPQQLPKQSSSPVHPPGAGIWEQYMSPLAQLFVRDSLVKVPPGLLLWRRLSLETPPQVEIAVDAASARPRVVAVPVGLSEEAPAAFQPLVQGSRRLPAAVPAKDADAGATGAGHPPRPRIVLKKSEAGPLPRQERPVSVARPLSLAAPERLMRRRRVLVETEPFEEQLRKVLQGRLSTVVHRRRP